MDVQRELPRLSELTGAAHREHRRSRCGHSRCHRAGHRRRWRARLAVFRDAPSVAAGIAGTQAVPSTSVTGGTLQGVPVIVSASAPAGTLTLIDAAAVLLADDGEIDISVSSEANVMLDSAPVPGTTAYMSLWQHNLVGILAERYLLAAAQHGGSSGSGCHRS
jgi:hypothetical protein